MAKLVVSEFLQEHYLDLLRASHEVVFDPDMYSDRPRLLGEVGEAEAIFIRNRTRIDEELIAAATRLRVVGRLGVGLDNIDMEACARVGIEVIPAVGANAVAVAEYVMGAMLVLTRGVFDMTPSMVAGEWPRQGHAFGHELMGMTLGLIGFGAIAREVANRATAFGMRIVAFDPFVPESDPVWRTVARLSFEEVLAESDVVSLHAPLTEATRNLIGESALALMKPNAVLINTSRGGTLDETAVADALRRGVISGAAIDVFESEPLGPEPASTFAAVPNLLLTPHVAGNTHEAVDRVARMIVSRVLEAIQR
ncbi:MAG TPA: hydroxyacid dehydrogenase [Acidimicrobiia bacterium]|nr:hydroxyacid dehydrogenase [Acidimicrobiia bacterium]